MEKLAFGEPVLDRLRQVCGLAAASGMGQGDSPAWPAAAIRLRRIDPKLAERLTRALIGSVIKEAENLDLTDAERLVRGFTRVAEPLAIDPNWNRLWAIIWDGPQADTERIARLLGQVPRGLEDGRRVQLVGAGAGPGDGLEPHGRAASRPGRRSRRWRWAVRLAGSFARREPGTTRPEVKRARKKVIECLEQSLELAPDHLPTYQLLVEVYRGWDESANLEAAAQAAAGEVPG